MLLKIKPLSVNQAWQGKRFKTLQYKSYEEEVLCRLKPLKVSDKPLELSIKCGLSSKNADVDNILKPFIDILQKKYVFNDKNIYKITIEKEIVKKGKEYIDFNLTEL